MNSEIKSVAQKLRFARSISFFGSAFSDFVLPLFIYETTHSAVLLGLQWTVNALFRLMVGKLSGHLVLWRKDRSGLIWLDVIQTFGALAPLPFWTTSPAVGTYIAGIIITICTTLQAGYLDSLVANLAKDTPQPDHTRTTVNAMLENGRNWGLFLGYGLAWAASTYIGFKAAIILDAVTFVASALIMTTIAEERSFEATAPAKASYSLLLKTRAITTLTASQMSLSFAIYIFNAAYIFTMKHHFQSSNAEIAALLIFQAVCYIIASHLCSRYPKVTVKQHAILRYAFPIIFVGFAFSNSGTAFILWNGVLSCVIGFTQPGILSLFQSHADAHTRRALGSARTSVTAVSGSIGAALSGFLLKGHDPSFVFTIGVGAALLGAGLFTAYGWERTTHN